MQALDPRSWSRNTLRNTRNTMLRNTQHPNSKLFVACLRRYAPPPGSKHALKSRTPVARNVLREVSAIANLAVGDLEHVPRLVWLKARGPVASSLWHRPGVARWAIGLPVAAACGRTIVVDYAVTARGVRRPVCPACAATTLVADTLCQDARRAADLRGRHAGAPSRPDARRGHHRDVPPLRSGAPVRAAGLPRADAAADPAIDPPPQNSGGTAENSQRGGG
jgi:hypothetical protein